MHLLTDQLTAVIIGTTTLLLLVAGRHYTQQAAIEGTAFYAQKQQQLSFIETLRRDMQGVSRLATVAEHPTDSTFVFYAQTSRTDTTKRQITYRRKRVSRRDGLELYQIHRHVDGVPDGGSPATMSAWEIAGRNEQGGAIEHQKDGRQVYVRFELAVPGSGKELARTRWDATFHPPLLKPGGNL